MDLNRNQLFMIKLAAFILLLIALFMFAGVKKQQAVEVVSPSEVPQKILQEVQSMPLEAGYYFFNASFAGEAYIMICGEKGEALDIEVERYEYIEYSDNKLSIKLKLNKLESSNNAEADSLPVVFLALDNRTEWITKVSGIDLEYKGWRTTDLTEMKHSGVVAQIIQEQKDIPEHIWSYMNENELKKGVYEIFTASELDKQYYIISGGDANPKHFNAAIIDFETHNRPVSKSKTSTVEFSLEVQLLVTAPMPISYAETLNKPYIVLKVVDYKGMDVNSLSPDGPYVSDIEEFIIPKEVITIK